MARLVETNNYPTHCTVIVGRSAQQQTRFLRHDPNPGMQFLHEVEAKQRQDILVAVVGGLLIVAVVVFCSFLPVML